MTQFRSLAKVIRSKNAGPFEITFDVTFDDVIIYERVKASNIPTAGFVAKLFNVPLSDVLVVIFFDPALAFKATLRRNWEQGSINERDTFGAQQHAPLFDVDIP